VVEQYLDREKLECWVLVLPVDILSDRGEDDVPVVGLLPSAETGSRTFAQVSVIFVDSPGRLHRHQRDECHTEKLPPKIIFSYPPLAGSARPLHSSKTQWCQP